MGIRHRQNVLLASTILALSLPCAFLAFSQANGSPDLTIGTNDVRIAARNDGGYDLYVRAKPGVASILLTETTKDPAMKADNFAYRAMDYNDVNGNEIRLLNGKQLPSTSKLYSLISSTPLSDAAFGQAFHILIPPVLIYGYQWSRSGTVAVGQGTYINIRAFEKRYADYGGAFHDNPYMITISTKPISPPSEPATVATASALQEQVVSPPPPKDNRPSSRITALIDTSHGQSLDLVLCLDTTASMEPYFDDIRKNLGPLLRERVSGFAHFRIGVVLYKDYWPDEYITRDYPYTSDISSIERTVKSAVVYGGGDIPEAEIEALYAAATEFEWTAEKRQVILLTDAPPHPDPRGTILFDDVVREAGAKHIEIGTLTVPQTIHPPNPDHPEFENEMKHLSSLTAGGIALRLFAVADGGATPNDAQNPQTTLENGLTAALAQVPHTELVRPPKTAISESGSAEDLAAIRKEASAAGATHIIISRSRASGAFSETVSRLIDVATGATLAHDVVWRAWSEDTEAVFVNGVRVK